MTPSHTELVNEATAFADEHPHAVGFALTPALFQLFRADEVATVPSDWYLLRMFDADVDLTLERIPGGDTRVERLTDALADKNGWQRLDPYQRVVWGTVHQTTGGIATMYDAQTPALRVPTTAGTAAAGGRLAVTAVEYLAVDEHGNAAVVAERLTGIDVFREA